MGGVQGLDTWPWGGAEEKGLWSQGWEKDVEESRLCKLSEQESKAGGRE